MIFPTETERIEERKRKKALGQLKPAPTSKQRGGSRPGSGRKSKYTVPTERITANLPREFSEALIEKHGSITAALEAYALQIDPSLTEYIKKD